MIALHIIEYIDIKYTAWWLLVYINVYMKSESERLSVMSDSLWSHGLYRPWNSLG